MRNCSARKEGGAGTFYKHVIKETHRQTYVLVAVSLYVDGYLTLELSVFGINLQSDCTVTQTTYVYRMWSSGL